MAVILYICYKNTNNQVGKNAKTTGTNTRTSRTFVLLDIIELKYALSLTVTLGTVA